MQKFQLDSKKVQDNIDQLFSWMKKHSSTVDAFFISSSDIHLSEYTPREQCHRYYVTGFTGSTGDVLAVNGGPIYLFVDGRYHEQADLEANFKGVEVVKIPYGQSQMQAIQEKILGHKIAKIGIESQRVSASFCDELKKSATVVPFADWDCLKEEKSFSKNAGSIVGVPIELVGRSVDEKLQNLVADGEGFFISALDTLAWLANCRGQQMPFQSSFMAKALALKNKLVIFVLKGSKIEKSAQESKVIEFVYLEDWSSLKQALLPWKKTLSKVCYSPGSINFFDQQLLNEIWPGATKADISALTLAQAQKNEAEVKSFISNYEKSDEAVFNTISWMKAEVQKNKKSPSELEFYNQANEFYRQVGALQQSFNTIAAYGPHSSIIHFSSSMADCYLKDGELAMLDSGGHYQSGYSTDSTRTFCPFLKPDPLAIKIYTLVLKGLLHAMNAVFPPGTAGAQIDALARAPLRLHGYDYGHGTGHGIGINVHEGHYSISPRSMVPLNLGLVGSIEPGIYIPGFGGVRLENGVVIVPHPEFPGMLCFQSLTYVGFEENLIDLDQMTSQEKLWLLDYEKACATRKRSSFSNKSLGKLGVS